MIGNAGQGGSVAISADGNTVIIGGNRDSSFLGAAWVFTRDTNNVWVQQGSKLVGKGSIGSTVFQGQSVALSADGNTAVVGAFGDNSDVGAIWVFSRGINGVWAQQGDKLAGTGTAGDAEQGSSVAISADGSTIIEGGAGDSSSTGATWVFARLNGAWTQQGGKLVGTDVSGYANQGGSVAIGADGNTAFVGGPSDNGNKGASWVFIRKNGIWAQQGGKLTVTGDIGNSGQGYPVAISADGNTAISGGKEDNNSAGAAWTFTRDINGVWKQHGNKLVGTGAIGNAWQGVSVALNAEGNTALLGGTTDNNDIGAAWVFTDSTNTLPVTLTNFNAYQLGKGVQTAWTGYEEINMAGYDIERSANGYQFGKIGYVISKNNNAIENYYAWFDASPLAGDNYYRIKAISKDASIQYSRIVKVTVGGASSGIQVYPNPVNSKTIQIHLTNIAAGTYAIAIYNISGQKVYIGSYAHAGGNASVGINLKGMAGGIYHIEMKDASRKYNTQVILQ
jgi:hypothetical protein